MKNYKILNSNHRVHIVHREIMIVENLVSVVKNTY
jgi:hypothetical protein